MAESDKRWDVADSAGRAAFYPARLAARAWRGRIESAAEDVLETPEVARVLDRALAGSLPEEFARSLVRHNVLERVARELAASGELERLIAQALASPQTIEITDRVLASDEMQRTLRSVASSPELRAAMAKQSAGLAEDVVAGARRSAVRLDQRISRGSQLRRSTRLEPGTVPQGDSPLEGQSLVTGDAYGGIATRGLALAFDSLAALLIFAAGSAVFALIASLVGGVRPQWLAGSLLGAGWLVIAGGYFVLFWSAGGRERNLGGPSDRARGRAGARDHPAFRRLPARPVRRAPPGASGLPRRHRRRLRRLTKASGSSRRTASRWTLDGERRLNEHDGQPPRHVLDVDRLDRLHRDHADADRVDHLLRGPGGNYSRRVLRRDRQASAPVRSHDVGL